MDGKHPKQQDNKTPFFKRKKDEDEDSSSDLSTTEDYAMEESLDEFDEEVFREECREWLAINAKPLFSLELSKHLAKQASRDKQLRKHAVKPILSRDGRMVSPLSIREKK